MRRQILSLGMKDKQLVCSTIHVVLKATARVKMTEVQFGMSDMFDAQKFFQSPSLFLVEGLFSIH